MAGALLSTDAATARLYCLPVGKVGNLQRVAHPLGALEPEAQRRLPTGAQDAILPYIAR
jgi:hypothetical protein